MRTMLAISDFNTVVQCQAIDGALHVTYATCSRSRLRSDRPDNDNEAQNWRHTGAYTTNRERKITNQSKKYVY